MNWLLFFVSTGIEPKSSQTELVNVEGSYSVPWWTLAIVTLLVIVKLIYDSRKH